MQDRLPVARLSGFEILLGLMAIAGVAALIWQIFHWRDRAIVAEARIAWEKEQRERRQCRITTILLVLGVSNALYQWVKLVWQIFS